MRLDLVQFGIGDALRREFARLRFQPGHDFEGVQDIGFGQFHRDRAPIGQQFDQAFGCQHLDGFAQRRTRDAQDFG